MQSKYQTRYVGVCVIIITAAWIWPALGGAVSLDQESSSHIVEAVLNNEITIMPQLNKLNFGFGRHGGLTYFYEKTISKLFFQDKKLVAKIIDVGIETSEIALELSHPILGTGTVRFFFSDEFLKQTTRHDIQKILRETLADENHKYVFLDPENKRYHLWSCNHFTNPSHATRLKREDAEQQGYRASKFCFKKLLYLPHLAVEKAIAEEWATRLGRYGRVDQESEKLAHLSAVGEKVLKNWPLKLLGYDYAFYLAESREINAFAIPAGKIIITTALLKSLDNDAELEALLVYAIAHIEQRHSLKKYHDCLQDAEYTDAMKKLAAVAGVITGPAGGGISGALNFMLPEESCSPRSLIGYPHENVRQADSMIALYFDILENDRRAGVSLLKKLQFSELTEKLHPDLRVHHPEKFPIDARIRRVENIKFKYFKVDQHFVFKSDGKIPIQLDLNYHQIFEKDNKVHIYMNEKDILQLDQIKEGHTTLWLSITDQNGLHRFELQENLFTEDLWGAHLTFSARGGSKQTFVQGVEKIVLTVGPTRGPNERLNDQPANSYTFVPGTIDW